MTNCRRCGVELLCANGLYQDVGNPPQPPVGATCTTSFNDIPSRAFAYQIRDECFARMIDRDVEELLAKRGPAKITWAGGSSSGWWKPSPAWMKLCGDLSPEAIKKMQAQALSPEDASKVMDLVELAGLSPDLDGVSKVLDALKETKGNEEGDFPANLP